MIKEISIAIILGLVFAFLGALAEYRYDLLSDFLK